MKKITKILLSSCLLTTLFSGCSKQDAKPLCRVVTGVEISCQHQDVQIRRHYTDTEKMEYVLIYLRLLKPLGRPDADPNTINADVYEITLELSDGNKKHYLQKDHRYFLKDTGTWQSISPEQAEGLYRLMRKIPGDRLSLLTF